ncbi:MAG: hypothetical protein HY549_07000 [Elusimicrobia bacterium]|nr:hypothetical protein [Elusimicrobiota bacterium]
MKTSRVFGASLLLAGLGCGGVRSRVHEGSVDRVIDQKPVRSAYFEAIGIGASDPALPTETQRKALARDAAIVKAQYEMLSMIKGVALEGGIRVERAIETDSALETRIKEIIQGAEVLKSEFTSDNGCVVTLRLPKSRVESLMNAKFE